MATNKTKVLIALVFLLLMITLGLSGKLLNANKNKINSQNKDLNSLNFYEFSQLLADYNYDDLSILVGVKDLKPLMPTEDLVKQKNKQYLDWKNSNNQKYIGAFSSPIIVDKGFKLLINFDNQNTNSEIVLSGKESLYSNYWWQDIHQLRIGYNNGEGLFLNFLNGQQEQSTKYLNFQEFSPGDSILLEFTDPYGQQIKLMDIYGHLIYEINLAQEKELDLPNGLFPYANLKIGINLEPKGKLRLYKLYLYELNNPNE